MVDFVILQKVDRESEIGVVVCKEEQNMLKGKEAV